MRRWSLPSGKDYKHFAADDDANGPVFFLRALDDMPVFGEPAPQDVAEAWLNYGREGVGLYWWGGYGVSTEHTAYLNLKNGIPAPQSGSIHQNGKTLAEQIGGQIFIDTWGLIAPADPARAARYAVTAASVSHDGEGLHGAAFMAAAISKAFETSDMEEIIAAGLQQIPADCLYRKVFDAVERGDAARGVVPFENSHAGDVSAVLDLCYNHPALWVVDVYDLPISQNLLVLPGTKLDQIRSVYSHQQAIAQSETFLRQFGLPATAMANTAMAAKFVAESGDASKAAIASVETAALYGLEVLVPSINTDGDNTTRFIVLSREKPTAGNRFSLLFTVDNKPGKLGEVIQIIGASGFNMESIKSRPMPHVPFEYYFYVELVGDPTADETAALLRELDRTCRTVRLLGVYTK